MDRTMPVETRSVALQTEIAASPVVVWNAITDPAELTRWFSLKAEVRPGNGGSMRLAWDEPVVANWQVEAWEPERRLSVAEMRPLGVALQPSEAGQVARSVDFCLERSDSHTVLRLTHHGFGCGPQWETLFAAVRRGWTFQLLSLRHYLERHAGTDRTVARSMRTLFLHPQEVWSCLFEGNALFVSGTRNALAEGGRYFTRLQDCRRWDGTVCVLDVPMQFVATLSPLNDALLRVYLVEKSVGVVDLYFWLASYDLPAAAGDEFKSRWNALLDRTWPRGEASADATPQPTIAVSQRTSPSQSRMFSRASRDSHSSRFAGNGDREGDTAK